MLKKIRVDGFRSLRNFQLDLHPGINVIVGPNGSGKTNILKFFEFLSNLADSSLSNAVSRLGGAGQVFSRLSNDKLCDEINFEIAGEGSFFDLRRKNMTYEYSGTISLTEAKDAVIFLRQRVRMSLANSKGEYTLLKNGSRKWDFDIEFEYRNGNSFLTHHKLEAVMDPS